MKLVNAKSLGKMRVYDLSLNHEHHSFQLACGVVSHNCGCIVANEPIHEFIPITKVTGVPVTSFTAKSVEAVGGIKYDFLGVSTLYNIQDAVRLIQERYLNGQNLTDVKVNGIKAPRPYVVKLPNGDLGNIWDLPEDQDVFDDICSGKTETVFQFSTDGAKKWLVETNHRKPNGNKLIDSIEEVAIFNALNRRGPLYYMVQDPEDPDKTHNILQEYYRRARGLSASQSIPPIIAELAPKTRGLIIYQETLQRIYKELTGCSGSEAEGFRIDIGKKQKDKIDAAYKKFMERATEKLNSADQAQAVWDSMKTFSGYGFNKSHAICYGIEAYVCAWLKHHYPLEWWTSVLRNADKDKVNNEYWRYAGHLINLPDIQLSGHYFQITGDRIQAPLSLLHGIGDKAHDQLLEYAPYTSIEDFANKIYQFRKKHAQIVTKTKKIRKVRSVKKVKTVIESEQEVTVEELGRSSINRRTVYTLIVSGAMSSLLPPDISIGRAMSMYDDAMSSAAKVIGSKYVKGRGEYPDLDAVGRYQIKKSILPAYGEDLRSLVQHELPPNMAMDGNRMRYHWKSFNRYRKIMEDYNDPVVSIQTYLDYSLAQELPRGGHRLGLVGYLESKRPFSFVREGRNNSACSLTIEVNGIKLELVKWGDDGKLPQSIIELQPGSVVGFVITRFKVAKGFSIGDLVVIRPPLKDKNDEE